MPESDVHAVCSEPRSVCLYSAFARALGRGLSTTDPQSTSRPPEEMVRTCCPDAASWGLDRWGGQKRQ